MNTRLTMALLVVAAGSLGALAAPSPPASSPPPTSPTSPTSPGGTGAAPGPALPRQALPASPTAPQSAVLRATHIVTLTVLSLEEGAWQPGPRGSQTQPLRITARLDSTLAGKPIAQPGARIQLAATRSQPGPRDSVAGGVWSQVDLAPGSQLVLLSEAMSPDPSDLLAEASLLRVLPAEPAASEIRRVLHLHRSGASLADALRDLREPPALSQLFAEYLQARLQGALQRGDVPGFDAAMAWLEQPGRSAAVQSHVADELTARLLSMPPRRAEFRPRFARALWRMLVSTADADLASGIESTYLPNLLGLEGAAPPIDAASVFGNPSSERQRIAAALRRRPVNLARDRLQLWLER